MNNVTVYSTVSEVDMNEYAMFDSLAIISQIKPQLKVRRSKTENLGPFFLHFSIESNKVDTQRNTSEFFYEYQQHTCMVLKSMRIFLSCPSLSEAM